MSNLNPYQIGLKKTPANYQPLTPLGFLERSASVYPDHPAIIHGHRCYNWAEVYTRSRLLASALTARGIRKGDTVAVIAANTPELYEVHFGVPMSGAVLNAINTRLD
ncbi:MAG TPA: acyl-CoA synthetase, partial [Gammaproteobacteria bacterium]|nr:acyl-CoA synthetase [Gammaproteobacteria bacterium]